MASNDHEEPSGDAPPGTTPLDAMRAMMQQAWTAPWAMAGRAAEQQASALDAWHKQFLEFAEKHAVFKTRVQKGGRLSIPEGERDALDLAEGDLVQVVILPLQKKGK